MVSDVWRVSPGGSAGDSMISAIVEGSEASSSTCSEMLTASCYDYLFFFLFENFTNPLILDIFANTF